jgi:hypothetical protein
LLFVYLYSDILSFFYRDIYVINTFVCTNWLKSTRYCLVDMQFELFFSIYFYKWYVCITCCVMGRIWTWCDEFTVFIELCYWISSDNLLKEYIHWLFFYPNMPIFMTDQNDTYLLHYPNATFHLACGGVLISSFAFCLLI